MKQFIITLLLCLSFTVPVFGAGTSVSYTIDPEKNAFAHNNMGIMYVEEKCYYAAIQEFKMAISLNPKKQATAVYFNNLGKVYMLIGYPNLALDCFKNAVTQYTLNLEYYKNLANCYKELKQVEEQLKIYSADSDKNPLNKVMLGFLYEESGNKKKAIMVFDEFSMTEPDLIITPAVKRHIQDLVEELKNNS